MAGIRGAGARAKGISHSDRIEVERIVHSLFSVRNMFFREQAPPATFSQTTPRPFDFLAAAPAFQMMDFDEAEWSGTAELRGPQDSSAATC
jgi:hypothetical protein